MVVSSLARFGGAHRESSDVTVNTPAPASCMESLSGCGQNSLLWTRFERLAEILNAVAEMKSVICVKFY